MIDLSQCYSKSNLKWLEKSVIYLTKAGSHSYGTNIETSDIDLRGISIPPAKYYLGVLDKFEQAIFNEPYDTTIFGIQKFIILALNNNPNCLELLFTDPSDHLIITEIGQSLLNIKESFLSKKCRFTTAGYAQSQLKRIRVHKKWLNSPIETKPLRSDYNLPDTHKAIPEHQLLEIEAAIRKILDEWAIDTTGMDPDIAIKFKNELYNILLEMKINSEELDLYAARYLGLNDNLIEEFKKERQYKIALRDYQHYQEWKVKRNPVRAELEAKWGFDCKHGAHLVRLYRTCTELLRDGIYNVKRHDAKELLEIRNGAWTFEQLIEWAEQQDKILDELYKTSTLRKEPERVKINEWLINTLESFK